ncbi:acyl-CoA dehydrogenase family protein [Streptomyces sp. MBT65]|uniref:acyl-CoA dehydrogenase n=1 Tax=Streptomyces sp. MBT65 TaxID=1488395 RepID=UPI00190A81B8|nr:acyl-CoA dehydrogenase [Streptomyces sp. MBT65]MBK3580962.1 acyl-CoA dehydrogenase family protein [Streptomyces sp. MBT65]
MESSNKAQSAALAEALEGWLGDPEVESNALSFAGALALDERDELPSAGIDQVRAFGFNRYFVPERLGGDLRSAEDILMLTRVIARRDMNVAVSESTQVWMMLAWIGGDAEQQEKYAATVLRGGVVPCLAYSEPGHGADLAANRFTATPDGDQYVLSGEKWPINRGRTSTHVVLLGITGDERTPAKRQQSMFLVDRSQVVSGEVTGVPRVPTYGLRGCDISGVAFDNVRIEATSRLGAEGEGLELALRGLLITRTFCTGLSLGTGDTMLRTVADFLSDRILYDGPANEIPYVTESLANAYLSLLVAECESLVAMRGLHLYTEQFSIWGNLAKVQVARLVDTNSKVLARTLGARYFLRAAEHVGTFQKMLRDGAVVSVFDGSEPVCLDSLALQLPALAKAHGHDADTDWRPLYDLRAELPVFAPHRVSVFGRGRDATFASLPALIERLAELAPSDGLDEDRLTALRGQATELQQELASLLARVNEIRRSTAGQPSPTKTGTSTKSTDPRLIRVAEELSSLHAKVAALGVWLFNRDHLDGFFADGEWLRAALARRQVHQYEAGDLEQATAQRLFTRMNEQRADREFFSVRPVRMAEPGAREAGRDDEASTTAA